MIKQIIADAGPLIAFGCIVQLKILSQLFSHIIIPKEVGNECLADISRPGAINISNVIKQNMIEIISYTPNSKFYKIPDFLGQGERLQLC